MTRQRWLMLLVWIEGIFVGATDAWNRQDNVATTRHADRNLIRGAKKSSIATVEQASVLQDPRRPCVHQLLVAAAKRGMGGGIPGAFAGVIQVITLMWLRTIMTYQLRYGTNFAQALQTLWREGGLARLYQGLAFALVQAPLCRFVSTAANDGVNLLLASLDATKQWGPGRKVAIASLVVGFWRLVLMPIDTMKTVLQVDSTEGFRNLLRRVGTGNFALLYQGAYATYVSSVLGHYPWYFTYNMLTASPWLARLVPWNLLRSGAIGFLASVVSDTVINSVRVVKTTMQTLGSKRVVTYSEAIRMVVAADGWLGLFGRGLGTRVFGNALQSIVFTVIWRSFADAADKMEASG